MVGGCLLSFFNQKNPTDLKRTFGHKKQKKIFRVYFLQKSCWVRTGWSLLNLRNYTLVIWLWWRRGSITNVFRRWPNFNSTNKETSQLNVKFQRIVLAEHVVDCYNNCANNVQCTDESKKLGDKRTSCDFSQIEATLVCQICILLIPGKKNKKRLTVKIDPNVL